MKAKKLFISLSLFALGGILGVLAYRTYRVHKLDAINARSMMPDSLGIKIDSTNLPIVFVETHGNKIKRDAFVNVCVKIIDNGDGQLNYGDTLAHPDQKVDFEGYMVMRHRGRSSYYGATKKSYALRAIDNESGKKKKSKLLGMRKDKKWALKASYYDRSMIRDALTFELARNYMDFVPQTRFCEVILNGVYQGVYCLSEQITANRLQLEKPGNNNVDITGGYLLQLETHDIGQFYKSKIWNKVGFLHEYPEKDKLTSDQMSYVHNLFDNMEKAISEKDNSVFDNYIDMLSMIDYQLASEFGHNGDAYIFSTYFYKDRDDKNPLFKFSLWDFDLGYGNYSNTDCSRTDTWVYDKQGDWWKEAMKIPEYSENVRKRWQEYRNGAYSDENIEQVIDSLTNVLTIGGAEQRNAEAWRLWGLANAWRSNTKPQQFIASSYEEEICYLKAWIHRRLQWMDNQLLAE